MRKRLVHIIALLIFPLLLAAQADPAARFSHYTTAHGLSNDAINDIRQDATGYIWIATDAGLNRFNGNQFVQYHTSSDSLSLPAEEVWGSTWIDQHRLGLFSAGLHIVNTKTGRTQNIFIPYHTKKYQFKFNMVMAVKGDEQGNIFILTRSGFYHFNEKSELVYRFDYFSEADVPVRHFYFGSGLYSLDEQRLMIVSVGGLYVYSKNKKEFRKMKTADSPLLAEFLDYDNNRTYQFYQPSPRTFMILKLFSDSIVYVDLDKNLKRISHTGFREHRSEFGWRSKLYKANGSFYFLTGHLSGYFKIHIDTATGNVGLLPAKYFAGYLCNSLLVDKDSQLWIGTTRGLFRSNPHKSLVETAYLPETVKNKFPNVRIHDILTMGDKIFVGTNEAGLFILDKKTLGFEKQVLSDAAPGVNYIRSISMVQPSKLLMGTNGPLMVYNSQSQQPDKILPPQWHLKGHWTNRLYRDSRNNIWISSHNIYKYHIPSGAFTIIPTHEQLLDVPFTMAEDREGHIWFGCHGLARYNTITNQYDRYLDSFPYIKMPDKQVSAIAIDQNNTLWFNTNNNGLIAYDIKAGNYRHFTKKDGLPDDNIASLMAIGDKIWIASFSGIACIDINSSRILNFYKEDGFPDMPIAKGSRLFYDTVSRQLYAGFTHAIARFQPESMLHKKAAPRVFIENVVVNGKKQHYLPGDTVTTSWKDDELQVTIGTINFSDGQAQRFAYRIGNKPGNPWVDIGSQSSFSISSLAPGLHRIQVKTYSLTNRWAEQVKEIYINVLPPLWLQPWFLLLAFLLVIILIYLIIKWRTGVVRKKEMEKTHMEALKAEHYKNQYELEQITHYFSSSLEGKNDEEEVLWDVAQNLIGRMDYEDCVIYLWNSHKTKMVQKAAWGPKGKPEVITADGFEVAPGQGIVGKVIETGQPILVNDTRKDARYRVDDQFRLSEVAVPIIHNNEVLGVIDSENSRLDYFSDRDIKILTTIATLIGNKLKQIESERSLEDKQKELAGINEQLAEARLSALQAQMNPHFVFNALNSIKRMILEGDNETASRYLSKFALMIRMTLEHSKEIFVTLDENIAYLKAYLEMEKLRFDGSFSYRIITDEQVDTAETVLPSMMIQPLVENAIWHGLMQATNDKMICIRFTQTENRISCTIEDNGIGIEQSEKLKQKQRPLHRSVGLENLRKRIKIMNEKYHTDCTLEIMDLSASGTGTCGTRAKLEMNIMNA